MITRIEGEIQAAEAFLALLSPAYLTSPWCRREQDLAIQVGRDRQRPGVLSHDFLSVLQIREVPFDAAGSLRGRPWLDLTDPDGRRAPVQALADVLWWDGDPGAVEPPAFELSAFRDREEELDRILDGITNATGPRFWLVTAPPQLGKSWFLARVRDSVESVQPGRWLISLVDLRAVPPGLRGNANALLARLLDQPATVTGTIERARLLARRGRQRLCLLDSAELLEPDVAAALRSELGRVYQEVQKLPLSAVRLALVVAGRRASGWGSVTPPPRLQRLQLTEFNAGVVNAALLDLSKRMGHEFGRTELQPYGALAQDVTQGLPVPLNNSLRWIEANAWIGLERLTDPAIFDELNRSYIEDTLLTQRSLFPGAQEPADDAVAIVRRAVLFLVSHRQATQSHLRHYIDRDSILRTGLRNLGWAFEELWGSFAQTSLLTETYELWLTIDPAIRKLLFRYFHSSEPEQADAHRAALEFEKAFWARQRGREQAVGLIETLWHEAVLASLTDPADRTERLSAAARRGSLALGEPGVWTTHELRQYATQRMAEDEELQQVLGTDGLLTTLIEIVANPES